MHLCFSFQPTLRLGVLAALISLGRLPASCMRKGVKLRANLGLQIQLAAQSAQRALESALLESGRNVVRFSLIKRPMELHGLRVGLIPNRRSTDPA